MKRRGGQAMVIEAGVVVGYLTAWAVRKARRVAGRLDKESDAAIDGLLDQLHELVAAKLGGHTVLQELVNEANAAGRVTEQTGQRVEQAIVAVAGTDEDEPFGREVRELVASIQEVERAAGISVVAGAGAAIFIGNAHAEAHDGGIAFGQVAGDVHLNRASVDPLWPGRSSH